MKKHGFGGVEFLYGLDEFDTLLKKITKKKYNDIEEISRDLSVLLSDFCLFILFVKGMEGKLSRLISDIILAKNGFPMVGLKLKSGDNYIARVHRGYLKNYRPMQELIKMKILDEIKNG